MSQNSPLASTLPLAIVTGANQGFGYATCEKLLQKGYQVILACRNIAAASTAADRMELSFDERKAAIIMKLDLSDLRSVVDFANDFKTKFGSRRLHYLILNAGVLKLHRDVSEQDIEITYATNHFGGVALVNLLLNHGIFSVEKPCRVVVVGSIARNASKVVAKKTDLHGLEDPFNSTTFYGNSKLFNHLWSFQLDKRFKASHGVSSNSVHPGSGLFTNLGRTDASSCFAATIVPILGCLTPFLYCCGFSQTWNDGGDAEIAAAEHPTSPHYFYRHWVIEKTPNEMADEDLQVWLYETTERILREISNKFNITDKICAPSNKPQMTLESVRNSEHI